MYKQLISDKRSHIYKKKNGKRQKYHSQRLNEKVYLNFLLNNTRIKAALASVSNITQNTFF